MFVPIFKEFLTFWRRIFKERFWKDGMLKLRGKRRKVVEQNGTYIIRQTYIESRCKSERTFRHFRSFQSLQKIRKNWGYTLVRVYRSQSVSNFVPPPFPVQFSSFDVSLLLLSFNFIGIVVPLHLSLLPTRLLLIRFNRCRYRYPSMRFEIVLLERPNTFSRAKSCLKREYQSVHISTRMLKGKKKQARA